MKKKRGMFSRLARSCAAFTAMPLATILSVVIVLVWLAFGPATRYSDTWQLVFNSFTSAVTFVMVFILSHGQKRDTEAMNAKLDALILANERTSNNLVAIEREPDERVRAVRDEHIAEAGT